MAATSSVNANVCNDTIVVDNSSDQEVIDKFLETDKDFEQKSNASATYQDRKIAYVGNESTPTTLSKRDQRGWSLGAGVGVTGTRNFWCPTLKVSLGYEGNKNQFNFSMGWVSIKPYINSDDQTRKNGLLFSMSYGRTVGSWLDHHLRLTPFVALEFQTNYDRQDIGSYSVTSREETETEIITTTEEGRMSYAVKPYMIRGEVGLELSYQLYNKPIGFYTRLAGGISTAIDGKENINGSADGVAFGGCANFEIGMRVYLHKKVKNVKARNMIRH